MCDVRSRHAAGSAQNARALSCCPFHCVAATRRAHAYPQDLRTMRSLQQRMQTSYSCRQLSTHTISMYLRRTCAPCGPWSSAWRRRGPTRPAPLRTPPRCAPSCSWPASARSRRTGSCAACRRSCSGRGNSWRRRRQRRRRRRAMPRRRRAPRQVGVTTCFAVLHAVVSAVRACSCSCLVRQLQAAWLQRAMQMSMPPSQPIG